MSFPHPFHYLSRKLRCHSAHHRRSCRTSPATTEISISRRIRQTHGHRRHQLGATAPLYNSLRSNAPSISARGCNLSHERIQRLPRSIQHHIAPSPLAQASVRNPLTLQKERTRKLQVHMGLAASTTARISFSNRSARARPHHPDHRRAHACARFLASAIVTSTLTPDPATSLIPHAALSGARSSFGRHAAPPRS